MNALGLKAQSSFSTYDGMRRVDMSAPSVSQALPQRQRCAFTVQANKKVVKKQTVVLKQDVTNLGVKGTITSVPLGFFRNYLRPRNIADTATEGILMNIQREKDRGEKAALDLKTKAKAMAVALQTIGKFTIRKKVGENDKIFGSVTPTEIVEAIFQQTGRQLDKKDVELPEISTLGTYQASIKLHPEVSGNFNVVVQREKN